MASSLIVLIAVAGSQHGLDKMLNSLAKCHKPANFIGTVVVENGTRYDAESITEKYREALQTQYFYLPRGNKSAALNYALTKIEKPDTLIFFTDDDGFIEENTLMAYDTASRGISGGCFFGGQMKVTYEKRPPAWLIDSLPPSAVGWSPGENDDYLVTPRFLGINWAAFAGDIKKLGGFNENLGPGTKPRRTGQEWEMQGRMLASGMKAVYVAQAVAYHDVPAERCTFPWALKRRFQDGYGKGILFVEENGKYTFPVDIAKYFIRACILLPVAVLSFSKQKIALRIAEFYAGLGRIKGYFTACFSGQY